MSEALVIDVVKPGLQSSFQDLGREGYQHLGVPVAGAMDDVSHSVANWLVGNPAHEATLEITLTGPTLRFSHGAWIALAGADLCASVVPPSGDASAAAPLDPLMPKWLAAGSTLEFGRRLSGLRSYLALRGGFQLPLVMGSASTHLRSATGGFEGRALRSGDQLRIEGGVARQRIEPLSIAPDALRIVSDLIDADFAMPMRVTRGREWDQFTDESRHALQSTRTTIGPQSDRMACRLRGITLERRVVGDMMSEAVAFGTVQVPPDGFPIVLMADRQSTGGYPRIAQVAAVDLPRLAQLMPGEPVRFELIESTAAQHLLAQRTRALARWRDSVASRTSAGTLHG